MKKSFNNLDELFNAVQDTVENEVNGEISFETLFDNGFLDRNSKYSTFQELLVANKIKVNSREDFENLDEEVLDKAINSCTKFATWSELYKAAGEEYIVKKMTDAGFDITR